MKITVDPEDAGTTISISQLPAEPGDNPEEEKAEIAAAPSAPKKATPAAPAPMATSSKIGESSLPSPAKQPVNPGISSGVDSPSVNQGTVTPSPKVANLLDRQGGENLIFDPRKGDPNCFQYEPPKEGAWPTK